MAAADSVTSQSSHLGLATVNSNNEVISLSGHAYGSTFFNIDENTLPEETQLVAPTSIFVTGSGDIYFADNGDNSRTVNYARIAKISASTGLVTTVVGNFIKGPQTVENSLARRTKLYSLNPLANVVFGLIYTWAFNYYFPMGIHVTDAGEIYYSDTNAHRIRKVLANGTVTTYAGGSSSCTGASQTCGDGGNRLSATLNFPSGK